MNMNIFCFQKLGIRNLHAKSDVLTIERLVVLHGCG